MIIKLSNQTLPDDSQAYVESERSRLARKKQLSMQVEDSIRVHDLADKRANRLDKYFSNHPPNGPLLGIFRDALANFRNTNGENPRWLTYEHIEASFARLQRAGILAVEVTADSFGVKTVKSEITKLALVNRRNVRPPEIDALIEQLKQDIGDSLQQPPVTPPEQVHGCRQVTFDKWRVRLYVGGAMRALGCYTFETAIRLQDALTRYFRAYRNGLPHYNTSETQAEDCLRHAAVNDFAVALEKHWLAAGVVVKPAERSSFDWREAIETRLAAIEEMLKITP